MSIHAAYDQIAELLSKAEPLELDRLQATVDMQERLESLISKSKANSLTKEEKDELDHFLVLERLIRLAKIRARARRIQPA